MVGRSLAALLLSVVLCAQSITSEQLAAVKTDEVSQEPAQSVADVEKETTPDSSETKTGFRDVLQSIMRVGQKDVEEPIPEPEATEEPQDGKMNSEDAEVLQTPETKTGFQDILQSIKVIGQKDAEEPIPETEAPEEPQNDKMNSEEAELPRPETPDAQIQEGPQKVLQYIMGMNPEDAENPLLEIPTVEADYFKDFGYSEDIVLSGIFEANAYYFQIPKYWDARYAYAQIEVELSQLIKDVPASLTFMVNGVPVVSYAMDYQNGKAQTFFVELPLELLTEGYNRFEITGYVRIYDDEGCIDDFSGANWISIRKSSFIQVGYDLKPYQQRISEYPYPFMSTIDETGASTSIMVSDNCAEGELAAALMLRADLGNETALEDRISLVRVSDVSPDADYRILVSLYDHLSQEKQRIVDTSIGGQNLKHQALVKILMNEENRPMLLITSDNESCLMEAVIMLLDEDRVSQEKTDQTFVKEDASRVIMDKADINDMEAGRYTLEGLMNSGLSFVGPFHQEGDIYLPFSGGYVLSNSGKVVLKFRYSENLDFRRSMITVYWGDVPVASKKLTKANAGGDELAFTMPADVVGTYAGKITIAFELELPDLFCTPRLDEMPWAYVTSDSTFYLPVGTGNEFTFSQRPYPFEVSSKFHDLCVVIPDQISAVELDTLGQVVARYGESLTPYGKIQAAYASSLSSDEDKAHNLIVIGNYSDNSLIRELNDKLYFRYREDGLAFQSNDSFILSDAYAPELVSMQLMYSPYCEDRAVLVVAATDDTTMENLREFISLSNNVWKLEKDTILIDSDLEIKTFALAGKKEAVKEPILKSMLESNEEAAIFTIVAASVMLLFLLAAVLILIRVYWRQKK